MFTHEALRQDDSIEHCWQAGDSRGAVSLVAYWYPADRLWLDPRAHTHTAAPRGLCGRHSDCQSSLVAAELYLPAWTRIVDGGLGQQVVQSELELLHAGLFRREVLR